MKNKNKIIIVISMISLILFSGCLKYGEGEAVGYISAVDDGIIWDKVWFKTSLEASSEDCYLLQEDSILKKDLRDLTNKQVKIYYKRHFATLSVCPEGTSTSDEIYKYEIINNTIK